MLAHFLHAKQFFYIHELFLIWGWNMSRPCWTVWCSEAHYTRSETHLNSTCRTDDWFPNADRTAMISQASYTLLNTNTDVFCCTVHVLNKERAFLFLDDSEGFMCIWKTHEIKIPEWNITEPFMKPSELLKIKLYKLNPNHTCFSWTEKNHIFQQSAGKTDHFCSFLCFNIWFE